MTFELYKLPYSMEALAPYISKNTLFYHYEKHHAGYLKNLNDLIKGSALERENLEDIILTTQKYPSEQSIFNNAAQVWNHTFYWNSLAPANTDNSKLQNKIAKPCFTGAIGETVPRNRNEEKPKRRSGLFFHADNERRTKKQNNRNMNSMKQNTKNYLLITLGLLKAFAPFVTDLYLPALPSLAAYF